MQVILGMNLKNNSIMVVKVKAMEGSTLYSGAGKMGERDFICF